MSTSSTGTQTFPPSYRNSHKSLHGTGHCYSRYPGLATIRTMSSTAPASASASASASTSYQKVVTPDSINQRVKAVEYAVRGELSNKANDYAQRLQKGDKDLPFDSVVSANIGNPQQQPYLAQKPLTFWRQVAALTEYPAMMDTPEGEKLFPADVVERAQNILEEVGSVGAYSHSKGASAIRQHVAEFIEERDGHPADPEMIYLTAGASAGVQLILSVLVSGPEVGVMIPIPQYPLYSAALAFYNAHPVRYELDSKHDWAVDVDYMERQLDEAHSRGVDVRALVVINPGNPTGSCLSRENVESILRLAHKKRLVVMADEVYQANIYKPKELPFVSFKKVLRDFAKTGKTQEDKDIAQDVELVSFHSISKGVSGECGRRGGYFELTNMLPDVEAQIYKMASVNLCAGLQGQIGVDLLVRPPRQGEPSYALYEEETTAIHKTLHERSRKMAGKFNELPGISCGEAQGALYLFPEITLPAKALEKAKQERRTPDNYYCLRLLDATGICVVPGSGFGKAPSDDGKIFL